MKNWKSLILALPEYLLIVAVIFYWFSAGFGINPFAIGLIALLVFQLIFKNRIIGLMIPSLLALVSCYMLLALMSEFNEFPSFNAEAQELLFVGLTFFLSTILVSGIMVYEYASMEIKNDQQALVSN